MGYEVRDIPGLCQEPLTLKYGARIDVIPVDRIDPIPMARSLGVHVVGAVPCIPNIRSVHNTVSALNKRILSVDAGVELTHVHRIGLRDYVHNWLRANLKPAERDCDVSIEHWLDQTHYTVKEKELMIEEAKLISLLNITRQDGAIGSFIKTEFYPDFKAPRVINGRCMRSKLLFGPYVKIAEEIMYKCPAFIKHVPVLLRPAYIESLRHIGCAFYESDYSSFEKSFSREVIEDVEGQLYHYLWSNLPLGEHMARSYVNMLRGYNKMSFKNGVRATVPATRMSGDMCTSLGNGFTNLMLIGYVCSLHNATVHGVVEGDDGLFAISGEPPTSQDFAACGFKIKLARKTELETSSFCGLVYDVNELENLADPVEVIARFGWTLGMFVNGTLKYDKQLLRAKAMSLAYECPACPILRELALYGLRVTEGSDCLFGELFRKNQLTYWQSQLQVSSSLAAIHNRLTKPISQRSRDIVYENFGISIGAQLEIEGYLRSLTQIQPLELPQIEFPDSWKTMWDLYLVS